MIYLFIIALFSMNDSWTLFDFNDQCKLTHWNVVNDGVMGGWSEGNLILNEEGHGLFSGRVSLENNGGFTSIRHRSSEISIKGATKAVLRVKGDGKRYQFRLKSQLNDWHTYIHYFETSGEWETITFPLNEMYPTFRGRSLNMPNFPVQQVAELALLIGNKKAEEFQLQIDFITLQ